MIDLPPGWAWATLEDVLAVERRPITDGPFGSKLATRHYTISGARVIRLQNIGDGVFRDEEAFISRNYFEELREHEVRPGDLLLASLGEELPRVCITPDLGTTAIVKADCIRARIHPQIDIRWVLYALMAPPTREWATSRIKGVGRPRLGMAGIRQIPLPIPPLAEQVRIVGFIEDCLSNLDAATRFITSAERRAESLWQSVLNSVAIGKSAGSPSKTGFKRIAEVAQVQGGIQKQQKRRPVKNKFPFLRVANVPRGGLDLAEVHMIELFDGEIERYRLEDGDLLVVEGNGSPGQIGRAAMWRNNIPDCVHQNHLIRVRPGPELDSHYLEYVWNAPGTAQKIRSAASSTSGLFTLSTEKVKSITIPVPSRAIQEKLVIEAQNWRGHLDAAGRSIRGGRQQAESLRRSLLTEAFSGRLVKQEPLDEPASVLLERIRMERTVQEGARRVQRVSSGIQARKEVLR